MKTNYYRPEIDGLRAIAVMAVIFYHADISIFGSKFFEGGFIGVDIFFTISGYLITSIIVDDKNFQIIDFYLKRLKRLLPTIFFVTLITSSIAFFLFSGVDKW